MNIVPPPGTPAKWAFVYLRFEQKRKKKKPVFLKTQLQKTHSGVGIWTEDGRELFSLFVKH